MPIYRPNNSPVWYVDIRPPKGGRRIRVSTHTTDKAAAQEYHDRIKDQLWRKVKLGEDPAPSWTWEDAAKIWLTDRPRSNPDKYMLRWITDQLKGTKLDSISTSVIETLMEAKSSNPGSYNRYIAIISTILKRASKRGLLKSAPTLTRKKESKGRIRWLTREEWKRLEAALPPYLASIARFAVATGLRENNALGLEWSQVDLARRVCWIHPDQAKGGEAIGVPLSDDAMEVLRGQKGAHDVYVFPNPDTGKPLTKASTRSWYTALKEAKIKNFRWHDLRHTWASWHIQAGTPLEVLQKLGGWKSITLVLRYAHLSPEHLSQYANNAKPRRVA